jgi:hypothetical protein
MRARLESLKRIRVRVESGELPSALITQSGSWYTSLSTGNKSHGAINARHMLLHELDQEIQTVIQQLQFIEGK